MNLRHKLIRLAHSNPTLRPYVLPLLTAGQSKEAAPDTLEFVVWALMNNDPIPTERVIAFLEQNGVPLAESAPTKRGMPLELGELVMVQAVNAPSDLVDLLKPFDLRKGTVVKIDGSDVIIKFHGNELLRVPGGVNAGKSSGVYRASQMEEVGKNPHIEVVYQAANEQRVSQVAIQQVRQYVERGLERGEERSDNYYSGYVPNYKISKENRPYFMMYSQQRGGNPRTLSPDKGRVYYIGIVGKRPAWKTSGRE